ncbi:DUF3071 domain-containing protein [Leucobacter sp. OH2974_COT-288]|nr:DUF3071 domain-containing protein [Leucobacter sp. OH2974_COT-288]
MTELTFASRTATALTLLDDDGNEYLLPVDNTLLHEVRAALQQQSGASQVRPAEIQRLLRRGLSVPEVAAETGYQQEDVERFAPPVERELSYILDRAFAVPVRTTGGQLETGEKFGETIAARLVSLGANEVKWRACQDAKRRWRITVDYSVYGEQLTAVWGFDSAKKQLTAANESAAELSKQQVADPLIPSKPRAVSSTAAAPTQQQEPEKVATVTEFPDFGGAVIAPEDEYDFEFGEPLETSNLDETANLLEALRQRRGEREREIYTGAEQAADLAAPLWQEESESVAAAQPDVAESAGTVVDAEQQYDTSAYERLSDGVNLKKPHPEPAETVAEKPKKRGRTAIPSWDEILFGTRPDDN